MKVLQYQCVLKYQLFTMPTPWGSSYVFKSVLWWDSHGYENPSLLIIFSGS